MSTRPPVVTDSFHPILSYLGSLPQFQAVPLHSTVIHLESGAFVQKFDGGTEPKYGDTLVIDWGGGRMATIDGWKYCVLQASVAAQLQQLDEERFHDELDACFEALRA